MNHFSPTRIFFLIILAGFSIPGPVSSQNANRRVSVSSYTETILNGKITRARANLYYEFPSGRIITMNTEPEKYVYMANTLGETKIYYPANNTVILRNDEAFSSRNNNLYYFFTNRLNDLGLQDSGFKTSGVKQEQEYTVTTWQAPVQLLGQVDKIDLVHENMLPVYSEYRNTKGECTVKVYYSDFQKIYESMVPLRVTEIIFLNRPDSTVRRTTYTNFRTGTNADKEGFDFTIPENAKTER